MTAEPARTDNEGATDCAGLQARLARHGRVVPTPIALHIAREVLAALDAAEPLVEKERGAPPRGVVHGAVSPRHIVFSSTGEVTLTAPGPGSDATYAPPEQARGLPLDERVDVYALGVVVYELVAGERLHAGDPPMEQQANDEARRARGWDGLDPDVAAMLERAVHPDRDARFASCADMLRAIDALMAQRRWIVDAAALRELLHAGERRGQIPDDDVPMLEEVDDAVLLGTFDAAPVTAPAPAAFDFTGDVHESTLPLSGAAAERTRVAVDRTVERTDERTDERTVERTVEQAVEQTEASARGAPVDETERIARGARIEQTERITRPALVEQTERIRMPVVEATQVIRRVGRDTARAPAPAARRRSVAPPLAAALAFALVAGSTAAYVAAGDGSRPTGAQPVRRDLLEPLAAGEPAVPAIAGAPAVVDAAPPAAVADAPLPVAVVEEPPTPVAVADARGDPDAFDQVAAVPDVDAAGADPDPRPGMKPAGSSPTRAPAAAAKPRAAASAKARRADAAAAAKPRVYSTKDALAVIERCDGKQRCAADLLTKRSQLATLPIDEARAFPVELQACARRCE